MPASWRIPPVQLATGVNRLPPDSRSPRERIDNVTVLIIWTLPDERMKTGVGRRIPLVTEAREIVLDRIAASDTDFLFPAYRGQPISDAAMATLMKRAGLDARPHGFRASFRTWVGEQTDAQFEVKEACLGHVVDIGVVGAYQRSDRLEKRPALLRQWEAFLLQDG